MSNIDLDENSINWKKKYPGAWKRVLEGVKADQEKEELQEAKKQGKKELSAEEKEIFQKKKLNSLILKKRDYEVKKIESILSRSKENSTRRAFWTFDTRGCRTN